MTREQKEAILEDLGPDDAATEAIREQDEREAVLMGLLADDAADLEAARIQALQHMEAECLG